MADRVSRVDDEVRTRRIRDFFATDRYLQTRTQIVLRAYLIRELVGTLGGRRLLDAGCGDGTLSLQFAGEGRLTLLDPSPQMLERARRASGPTTSQVTFVEGELESFRAEKPFAVVLCVGVLAHVASLDIAIARLSELVAPGGVCVVQLTDHSNLLGRALYSYHALRLRLGAAGYTYLPTSRAHVIKEFEAHGLRLSGERRFWSLLPGMKYLPDPVRNWYQSRTANRKRLERNGAEVLLRFVRD